MKKYTSVVDKPKSAVESDLFGIDQYEGGLVRFIEGTQTPITIAIQGEWGSGKTSLMNKLKDDLCDQEGKRFVPIWLNTWQYSLMKDPDQALISIIRGLTDEIAEIADKDKSETAKQIKKVFANVMKATTKVAVRVGTGQDASEIIDAFDSSKEVTILALRNALNDAIQDILQKENKDGFLFFIDDLDRIDPPMAVTILELLKNIFDLDNCVFVLAIDYDVVVKGLEPKFGPYTEKNEREFRSFFDKIIQLPFSMPTSSYEINDFLVSNLNTIGYLKEEEIENEDFVSSLSEMTRLSVGSNPRSLKRLLNSISLINCINDLGEEDDDVESAGKLINYALINIQTAYPALYSLLVRYPAFDEWNEKLAMALNLPAVDKSIQEKLDSQDEFDEVWEKVLFRFCQRDHFLKKKSLSISQLLNKIKDVCPDDAQLGELISAAISMSAVTSVDAVDAPATNIHISPFLRKLMNLLVPAVGKRLKDSGLRVECTQKRFQVNGFLEILRKTDKRRMRIEASTDATGLKLVIHAERGLLKSPFKRNFKEELEENGMMNWFEDFEAKYREKIDENPRFELLRPLLDDSWRWKKIRVARMRPVIVLQKTEEINDPEVFQQMVEVISQCVLFIDEISKKRNIEDLNKS